MQPRGIIVEGISMTHTKKMNHSITLSTNHGILNIHVITYKLQRGYFSSPFIYYNKLK